MPKLRTRFVFKSKREHIPKVNIPNMVYPNQDNYIELYVSKDLVIFQIL